MITFGAMKFSEQKQAENELKARMSDYLVLKNVERDQSVCYYDGDFNYQVLTCHINDSSTIMTVQCYNLQPCVVTNAEH